MDMYQLVIENDFSLWLLGLLYDKVDLSGKVYVGYISGFIGVA
jgi:hypothetical protein